ncbi:MAG: hypothetical protein QOF76_5000 [Solirubrobacteraceae bacterium]|jgi:hypothetical protein|nr:hypothetical protein [Solirubrobacteraceae bacterium]
MTGLRYTRRTSIVGAAAVLFSALYLLSDALEAAQGGFSTGQLWLTLIAEAAIPIFVIGLWAIQRPQISRLGRFGAVIYAVSYVFFTGTVVYALVKAAPTFDALDHVLSPWMTIGGGLMVLGGTSFGAAVIRARVLPSWTGATLVAGVLLVALAQALPEGPQLCAAGIRDLGFAGMGVAALAGYALHDDASRTPAPA